MNKELAEMYLTAAGLMAVFISGLYIARGRKKNDEVWILLLGVFWPLVVIGVVTYPFWKDLKIGQRQ